MTALEYLKSLHAVCHFQTKEGPKVGRASNSELRRWINNGALVLNGYKVTSDEPIDFPILSSVLFPKKPVTLV